MLVVKSLTSSIMIGLRENPGSYWIKGYTYFSLLYMGKLFSRKTCTGVGIPLTENECLFSAFSFYNHWQFVKWKVVACWCLHWDLIAVKVKHVPCVYWLPLFLSLVHVLRKLFCAVLAFFLEIWKSFHSVSLLRNCKSFSPAGY